jgi:hypothetical protein
MDLLAMAGPAGCVINIRKLEECNGSAAMNSFY